MSALAIAELRQSFAEIIDEGVRRAIAGEPVRELQAELWARGLDTEAIDIVGPIGLGVLIHSRLAIQRHPGMEAVDDGIETVEAPGRLHPLYHPARDYWRSVLQANYEGADGVRRALVAFSLADVDHLRVIASARAAGYTALRTAMELAAEMLARYHKSRIGELPEKAQREIAEKLS